MGIFTKSYDYDELIRITGGGVSICSGYQVTQALINKAKDIWGNDIDLNTGTSDREELMMHAMIITNMLKAIKALSLNMNPGTASGNALDTLCAFNHVSRKNASYSTAYCYVVPTIDTMGLTPVAGNANLQSISIHDKSGNEWEWIGASKNIDGTDNKFLKDKIYTLQFTCTKIGQVNAKADQSIPKDPTLETLTSSNHGELYETIDANLHMNIWQASDAAVGNNDETDNALKNRLNRERGNSTSSTLDGLRGSLLEVNGIADAKIYNNNSSNNYTANDENVISPHNIYIILRYTDNITPSDEEIGTVIYNKITPGIVTTQLSAGKYGTLGKYTYVNSNYNLVSQNLYWKIATPIQPEIVLKFMKFDNYISTTSEPAIITEFKTYMKEIGLSERFNVADLLADLNTVDEPINNKNTFMFITGYVNSDGTFIDTNKDTYYNYDSFETTDFVFSSSAEETTGLYTLTIKKAS